MQDSVPKVTIFRSALKFTDEDLLGVLHIRDFRARNQEKCKTETQKILCCTDFMKKKFEAMADIVTDSFRSST